MLSKVFVSLDRSQIAVVSEGITKVENFRDKVWRRSCRIVSHQPQLVSTTHLVTRFPLPTLQPRRL